MVTSPPPLPSENDAPPPSLFPDADTSPPPLPPDSVYTSCYCEENIYLLAQAFTQLSDTDSTADDRGPWPWQIYVVFISNGGKTVRDSITFSPPHFKVATASFISLNWHQRRNEAVAFAIGRPGAPSSMRAKAVYQYESCCIKVCRAFLSQRLPTCTAPTLIGHWRTSSTV